MGLTGSGLRNSNDVLTFNRKRNCLKLNRSRNFKLYELKDFQNLRRNAQPIETPLGLVIALRKNAHIHLLMRDHDLETFCLYPVSTRLR